MSYGTEDRRMTTRKQTDPEKWDIDTLIESLGVLNDEARTAALSVFAHHLTVEIRVLLSVPPFDQPVLDRVRAVNEFEHHLTGRLHPAGLRPPEGDMALLHDIAADAARCGLTAAVKRSLVIAARNAIAGAKTPVPAH
jgi:hypothetical protein